MIKLSVGLFHQIWYGKISVWIAEISSASGAEALWPPDQGPCTWTPLGAKPSDSQYRLALRARHECCPHTFQTVRGYASVSEVMKGILDISVWQNSYGSQWQWHFSAIRPILFLLIQSTTVCTIHDIGHLHVLLIFFISSNKPTTLITGVGLNRHEKDSLWLKLFEEA